MSFDKYLQIGELTNQIAEGIQLYKSSPKLGRQWGGPFNGQAQRCLTVSELVRVLKPKAIIETGTYLGTSTEWLSAFQIPLWSVEANAKHFGYSYQRLFDIKHVKLHLGDSRRLLKEKFYGALDEYVEESIFFYLDAHWEEDLPLREELEIIFSIFKRPIVLIDDFKVDDDDGYRYDDYGPEKKLDWHYISPVLNTFTLAAMYPSAAADTETGARRGSIILARQASELSKLTQLRPAK